MTGDLEALTFTWADLGIEIEANSLRESSRGQSAEIDVRLRGETLHLAKLNLLSTSTRATLAKALGLQARSIDWRNILEDVCRRTVTHLRTRAETVRLTGEPLSGPTYAVEPLVWHEDLSIAFADGGSLKSYTALAIAVAAMTGKPVAGLTPRTPGVPVLYLDWESNRADLDDRLGRLGRGLGWDVSDLPLYYRAMARPWPRTWPPSASRSAATASAC